MSIDERTIDELQTLAALHLHPSERSLLISQLERILGYVDQLGELDTEGVEPTASVIEVANVLREDDVQPSLPVREALAAAPRQRDSYFEVPVVLGGQP